MYPTPAQNLIPDAVVGHVLALGLSRRTAAVALREQIALVAPQIGAKIARLKPSPSEWAALVTCHRFELYMAVTGDIEDRLLANLYALIHEQTGVDLDTVRAGFAVHRDQAAAQHLCRVAAGLDSAVLGEAQIQGQVAAAYTQAIEEGTVGPALSLLFRTAIRAGKQARSETAIGARATSMSSLALRMAEQQRGSLTDARVLVIGAGEMAHLALKALAARHVGAVTVANRSVANARAALLDARWAACALDEVPRLLQDADVIVSATSAPGLIITAGQVAHPDGAQRRFLIDLAVPRDIDPAVRGLSHVTLIDVDDLREGLDESLAARLQAVPAVEAMLEEELARWHSDMTELAMRPLVVELRRHAEKIRQEEVARTLRFLGDADDATQAHIQHLSRALVNKLLHEPTTRIRELSHHAEARHYAATIRRLFGLNGQTPAEPTP
jgi:glutamyl-tRNA reductase